MEQLHLSDHHDAIDLHPEIPVNISCQCMETMEPLHHPSTMIASDLEGSFFFGIDSTWLSKLAGIEPNFENT